MTLSDQAATGSADREAVAIALGWERTEYPGILWGAWYSPAGVPRSFSPPNYQNDLPATLAEIERRGWEYAIHRLRSHPVPYACNIWTEAGKPSLTATSGTTIANAACAALLKALENSDGN